MWLDTVGWVAVIAAATLCSLALCVVGVVRMIARRRAERAELAALLDYARRGLAELHDGGPETPW
ncbi:MAG: hypothetical protein ACRDQ7_07895 [Haloechinothrix sp.]